MCGICGAVDFQRTTSDSGADLATLSRLMRRRGPDAEGTWNNGRGVAFAFRRLAIIDPTPASHQPFLSTCGRYALVFNGELYNFRELRAGLQNEGIRFRSRGDSEVVLYALATWGQSALSRFNGMFALAWYDNRDERLILARDPLGIKPLYYLFNRRGLVFGSQYDQLLAHPFFGNAPMRPEVLGLYLRIGHIPAPYALFESTHQLPPGHLLELGRDLTPRIERYFAISPARDKLTNADALDALRESIMTAVRRQMVSDVPIGVFLSGGVDSPIVAAAMRKGADDRLAAFTIGVTDTTLDESARAAEYARVLSFEHHVRRISDAECLGYVETCAQAYSEPFGDYSALPTLMVSSVASGNVKVALSGDGADELFWGYPRSRKLLASAPLFEYPRALRLARYAAGRLIPAAAVPAGVRFGSLSEWQLAAQSAFTPSDLGAIAPGVAAAPDDFDVHQPPLSPDDDLAEWIRLNELGLHLQMMLLKVDRATMHFGLETRVPMLDLDVVSVAMRIEAGDCVGQGQSKIVLRKILAGLVPDVPLDDAKRGFDVPMAAWLRGPLRQLGEDLLVQREPYPSGAFDRRIIERFWSDHMTGRVDRATALWHLLSLQLWAGTHLQAARETNDNSLGAVTVR